MTTTTPFPGARTSGTLVPVDHRTVLVPLDGSDLSEHALEPARWLAAHLGATVHTVVVGYVDDPRWYTRYTQSLRERSPQLVPHFVAGLDVASGIVDLAAQLPDCLVCIGTHGRSRSAALLGSTFVDVARSQPEPLVAIGPHADVPRCDARRVVACVDGTATSEQILPLAGGWARRLDATLDIVAVVEPLPPLPTHGERHGRGALTSPTAYVTELTRRPELVGLDVEAHVAFDPLGPEQGLVGHLAIHPATLVATTSRLRIHVDRALHGSTASRIIHASPVPVLVQAATWPAVEPGEGTN
jgi:nucleotide-binding universal stress UspA family protein